MKIFILDPIHPAGVEYAAPSEYTGPWEAACGRISQLASFMACQMPFRSAFPSLVLGAL